MADGETKTEGTKKGREVSRSVPPTPEKDKKKDKKDSDKKDAVQILGQNKKTDKGSQQREDKKKKDRKKNQKAKKFKEEKKVVRKKKKSCVEQTLNGFGIGFGTVTLRDPRALEAAQALNLSQAHLQKLRIKFDRIDVDGSGNIDAEEFFEAVGEKRSPLTDRLFQLIDLDGSGTIEFDECKYF